MNALLRSITLGTLVGAALSLYPQVAAAPVAPPALAGEYVPDEVLVKFKPTAGMQARMAAMAARGHSVVANLNQPGWAQVKVRAGQTMEAALAAYRNDANVEYVQPNYIYRAAAAPNDTQYGQLWAFKNTGQPVGSPPVRGTAGADMNIEPAWDHITDCSSVAVAVLDTGVNYTHQDLAANMWNGPNHGHDAVEPDNDPMDESGHGTHVAGIVGAVGNNGAGTTGVCQKASIMAVRVLDADGKGTTATAVEGIGFAVTNGARVINMSLVGDGTFSDPALSDAITNAQIGDVVVVVVAGNTGDVGHDNDLAANATYPCNLTQPNLVCVAALDQNYALAGFSNWGATSVDVGAPGTNILSTTGVNLNSTSYGTMNGTSMASPEVAGLAAMLRAYNPQYTYADTVGAIKNGGRSVQALAGKTTTGKAVDVMSSLAYINPPTGLTATVQRAR
jgi:subtilisin family serine protease